MNSVPNPPRCYSYVRFSTSEQLRGDSLRRQEEMSAHYARENGLHLDDSLRMQDLGLSAYKGENRTKGALKQFIDAIKQGKVPRGSYLLVESLDRLSRESVLDAFDQFKDILKHGITIVTLADRMEYTEQSVTQNAGQLFISLAVYARANEESRIKSLRLSEAWAQKRDAAIMSGKPLTGKCPAWLRMNQQGTAYEIIRERAEVIREIFDLYIEGLGKHKIEEYLNTKGGTGVEPWGGGKGWHASYVWKILNNRSVIGEYQPHTYKDGKRVPTGSPIANYFPAVVDESTFYHAQERMNHSPSRGGRTGKAHNLFSGIVRCGYCRYPMHFIDKGKPPKGGRYLLCDGAKRRMGCKRLPFKYDDFQRAVLNLCTQLNLADVLPDEVRSETESRLAEIRADLVALEAKEKDLDSQAQNLIASLAQEPTDGVRKRILEFSKKIDEDIYAVRREKEEKENEYSVMSSTTQETVNKLDALKQLAVALGDGQQEDNINLRLRLRMHVRSLIEYIETFPAGYVVDQDDVDFFQKNGERLIKSFLAEEEFTEHDVADVKERILGRLEGNLLKNKTVSLKKNPRLILVRFRSGVSNLIASRLDEPSEFILRAHTDPEQFWLNPAVAYDDSGRTGGFWEATSHVIGLSIETILVEEIARWEKQRAC